MKDQQVRFGVSEKNVGQIALKFFLKSPTVLRLWYLRTLHSRCSQVSVLGILQTPR